MEGWKEMYEGPLAEVRGVILLENTAAAVSVLVGSIRQEDWDASDVPVGEWNLDGDIDLVY
jgi:hypothetical protein